jgi:hypothetical protein
MPIYKVSFVVAGGDHPGAIVNMSRPPEVGERVRLGEKTYQVIEVLNLIPPRGEFHYLHATCRAEEKEGSGKQSRK